MIGIKSMIKKLFLAISLGLSFQACTQESLKDLQAVSDTTVRDTLVYNSIYNPPYYEQFYNKWVSLDTGLVYTERDGPRKAVVNDSKISILKINPTLYSFKMLSGTQIDSVSRCVVDWAGLENLSVVINASMYDLRRKQFSKGYLRNTMDYANNANFWEGYNMAICFNPIKKDLPNFDVVDLKCTPFEQVKKNYASIAQGMRMIDCDGIPLSWNKNPQSCSQLIVCKDLIGNIYYIFTRSPYTHTEMIQFMMGFETKLVSAIYLEGGPQTSLLIDTDTHRIEKLGSFVSRTYPTDKNAEFWPLPNVIGIVKK